MTGKFMQTTIRLPIEVHDKLREISYLQRISIQSIILNAINMYIESEVKK